MYAWRTTGDIDESCCRPTPVAPPIHCWLMTYRNRHSATTQVATAKYPPVSRRSSAKMGTAATAQASAAATIAANGLTPPLLTRYTA